MLNISEDETKYVTLDRKHGSRIGQNITIDDYNFEEVQSCKCLGSIVNVDRIYVEISKALTFFDELVRCL